MFLLSTLAAGVLAQENGRPRIDPGGPPQIPGGPGSEAGWQVITIPSLPAMARLGDIWARALHEIYFKRATSEEALKKASAEMDKVLVEVGLKK